MKILKEFVVFLLQTPKASLSALGVAIAQILKYSGLIQCDQATVDKIMDSLSIIFGFVGLFFASKGKWPTDPGSAGGAKKIVCFLLILSGLLAFGLQPASAGSREVTFAWGQEVTEDLAGWNIKSSYQPGGPYETVAMIPFTASTDTGQFTTSKTITVPDAASTKIYFVLTALDKQGNESAPSNEVFYDFDFKAPDSPFRLTITVKTPGTP